MTYWVFTAKHVDDYIDPRPEAFKKGTFMYSTIDKRWYRCSPWGPAPKKHGWNEFQSSNLPKHVKVRALLLGIS